MVIGNELLNRAANSASERSNDQLIPWVYLGRFAIRKCAADRICRGLILVGIDMVHHEAAVNAGLPADSEYCPWRHIPVKLNDGKPARLLVWLLGNPLDDLGLEPCLFDR